MAYVLILSGVCYGHHAGPKCRFTQRCKFGGFRDLTGCLGRAMLFRMSKSSRHRGSSRRRSRAATRAREPSLQASKGRHVRIIAVGALILAMVGISVLALLPDSRRTDTKSTEPSPAQPAPVPSGPASLEQLTSLAAPELDEVDIARMNLLAAEGLPGAENLDISKAEAELDRWAAYVKRETDQNLYRFHTDPANFEDSEAYFRVLTLITVLQRDLGVHYNPERINEPDFTKSKDLFIHGMIGDDNGGTCVSMPALTVAVGRRLGYPLKLVVTKGHVFARWDAPDHPAASLRGRFNVECASRGLHTYEDEHYANWPFTLSEAEIESGWYLQSLTPAEELAVFLINRGYCLEDTGRIEEAESAYRIAARLAPESAASAYLAVLDPLELQPVDELDELAEASARRAARKNDIDRIMERQRQRMHDLRPQPPTPGGDN